MTSDGGGRPNCSWCGKHINGSAIYPRGSVVLHVAGRCFDLWMTQERKAQR